MVFSINKMLRTFNINRSNIVKDLETSMHHYEFYIMWQCCKWWYLDTFKGL